MFACDWCFTFPDVLHPLVAHVVPHRTDMSVRSSLPTTWTAAQTVAKPVPKSRTVPIAIISRYALMPTEGSFRLREVICIQ